MRLAFVFATGGSFHRNQQPLVPEPEKAAVILAYGASQGQGASVRLRVHGTWRRQAAADTFVGHLKAIGVHLEDQAAQIGQK
jgi:hypothetical protein